MTKAAAALQVGDVILPPAREMSLWMRRHARERGLTESALHLTVTQVREGATDKRGRWLIIKADHTPEWNADGRVLAFTFKARPETPWPLIVEGGR